MRRSILVTAGTLVTAALATAVAADFPRSLDIGTSWGLKRMVAWSQSERARQLAEFRGTELQPSPELEEGAHTNLLEAISKQFALQHPVPQSRLDHFRWCDQPRYGVRGWYGTILDLEACPGGWLVQLSVSPHLVSREAGVTSTSARYIEIYKYTPRGLQFLSGRPGEGPSFAFGD